MARVGSFQGPETPYGVPGHVVHPVDNVFPPPNLDPYKDFTEEQRIDFQKQLDVIRDALGLR